MRCFRDLAIAVLWTGVVLVALELGLRAGGMKFDGSFYQPDPVCYAAFRPNAAAWIVEGENFCRINSLGMRDRERTIARPAHTLRIAVVGDSMTAAQQVPLADIMTQVMESDLSRVLAPGERAEVLNFAVGGYSVAQMYLTLREKIWKFQPDVVMAFLTPVSVPSASRRTTHLSGYSPFFVYRDGVLVPDPRNAAPPRPSTASLRRSALLKDLYNRFFLLQLGLSAVQTGVPELLAPLHAQAPAAAPEDDARAFPFRPPAHPAAAEAWRVAEGLLESMNALAREHGAEFWIVTHADAEQCDPVTRDAFRRRLGVPDLEYTDRRWAAFAADRGIPLMATAPALLAYAAANGRVLHGFFNTPRAVGHLNLEGNRASGHAVAATLLARSRRLHALAAR